MEAIMGSSSPYLKLVSSGDTKMPTSLFRSPLHPCRNNHTNKDDVDFKLSISVSSTHGRGFRPISLSSSDTQAEVKSQEHHMEESINGYTIEAKADEILETKANAETQTVRVRFQLQRECSFGENFLIVGDDPIFGLWDPTNAIPLTWSDGHVWTVDLDIPIGKCIKFKFIMQGINGQVAWQPGPDRILEFSESEKIITLCEDWENPDSRRIIEVSSTLNQVKESPATLEMQMVADQEGKLVEPSLGTTGTLELKKYTKNAQPKEPKGYDISMKQVLVSNEALPILVPGLSQLPTTDTIQEPPPSEASEDEPESTMNGTAMIPTGVDMAIDLNLPELDLKQHENQDSCDPNEHWDTQHVAEEREHETTQPAKGLSIHWGHNFKQKLLEIFGIFDLQ